MNHFTSSAAQHRPAGSVTSSSVATADAGAAGTGDRERPTSSSSAPARAASPRRPTSPTTGLDVAAAGEVRVPPREGLRRRADPPRGPELITLGIPTPRRTAGSTQPGPAHHRRRHPAPAAAGPTCASFPPYGLVRTRSGLRRDPRPPRRASTAPACTSAPTSPARSWTTAPAASSASRPSGRRPRPRRPAPRSTFRAPVVVARRRQLQPPVARRGRPKRDDRPMGVAVRTYYTSPRHDDDYLESWLELWSTRRQRQEDPAARLRLDLRRRRRHQQRRPRHPQHLQGLRQGRLQGRDAALGRDHARGVDLQRVHDDRAGPRRRPADGLQPPAALRRGLLLVGDAGGMVNPFNGEGIAYAMESGRLAADVIAQACARGRRRPRAGAAGLPRGS